MSLIERRRTHEENHKRSLDMQILDALLRIEELLTPSDDDTKVDGDIVDVIKTITPTPTPFQKLMAAKPKGARGKVDRL